MQPRLVIVNDISADRGGTEALVRLSARLMRARGVPVTMFCGDDGSNPALAAEGIEVVGIDGVPLLNQSVAKSMASGLWNARAKAALADFIARTDTPETVYHVHGWAQILSPSIFTALQPVAARTLAHAHDFFLACPNGVFTDYRRGESCRRRPLGLDCLVTNCDKRSYSHKLWRAARTAALRRSFAQGLPWGGIVLLHPGMAPIMALAGFDQARMFVARNPVTPYSSTRIPAEANERFFFIGRIEEDKGIRSLIAAAQAAGVGLTVVGDGPLREELARAHPDVEFTGWKTREEIEPLVQTARCVAVPARHGEPFGLVITEALQSGIPVIMGETSLLASDVVDKGLGFACDMRRPKTLTAAIARLRDLAPEEVKAMSLHAMRPENALASSPEAWADRLLELYQGLLQPAAR